MSGGHFNDNGYTYYPVDNFADQLEIEIERNEIPSEWDHCYNFPPEVIHVLQKSLPEIRRVAKLMKHIDYLYSGDYGEDTFLKRIAELDSEEVK
jgi:hypothetical protein